MDLDNHTNPNWRNLARYNLRWVQDHRYVHNYFSSNASYPNCWQSSILYFIRSNFEDRLLEPDLHAVTTLWMACDQNICLYYSGKWLYCHESKRSKPSTTWCDLLRQKQAWNLLRDTDEHLSLFGSYIPNFILILSCRCGSLYRYCCQYIHFGWLDSNKWLDGPKKLGWNQRFNSRQVQHSCAMWPKDLHTCWK